MVVAARLDFVLGMVETGAQVMFSYLPNADSGKLKVKILIRETGQPPCVLFTTHGVEQVQFLRQLVSSFSVVDRGHKHTDGTMELCMWFTPHKSVLLRHDAAEFTPSCEGRSPFRRGLPLHGRVRRGTPLPSRAPSPRSRSCSSAPEAEDMPSAAAEAGASSTAHTWERKIKADKWVEHQELLLARAVAMFQYECAQIAEKEGVSQATVSFEVLSRAIEKFPKKVLKDSCYFVESFGNEVPEESWIYAVRGLEAIWTPGEPIPYQEVLHSMFLPFVAKIQMLGYSSCKHIAGTWKLTVTW
ncbi:unnamed protein product [Prorocentrum cordatum]|uniref:Uncharacterized protein n=1 Tax=Prorocentrum cordatum TaxID=2364126 RepID=A0ABN9TTJ0_9DINO|nr:unnamed protein product [Polarella glacialis]